MATAVSTITAPSARCSPGPRRMRVNTARPASASTSSTAAEPSENASPTASVRPDAAPTETTAARIGPAHGAYRKPSAPPTSTPDQNPRPTVRGPKRARRLSGASSRSPSAGTATATPKPASARMARSRVADAPSPTPSTTVASPTIVTVNVAASPSTMPSGRRRPPVAPALSSAGSTGSTQGLSAVPAPARNAKRTSREMANRSTQAYGAQISVPMLFVDVDDGRDLVGRGVPVVLHRQAALRDRAGALRAP